MKITRFTPVFVALCVVTLAAACSRGPAGEKPRAEYDKVTGRLKRLVYDANRNGRNDAVSIMDGTRIHHIELDLDENGKVDRWDFYREDRSLEKVGLSRLNDGVMDSQAYYGADGALARIEVSTKRDGRYDRVEFYAAGALVRSEEDADGNGRPEKWDTYRPNPGAPAGQPAYAITSSAFDDEGRGTPNRRFVYGANGAIELVEIDPDGDGTFESAAAAGIPTAQDEHSRGSSDPRVPTRQTNVAPTPQANVAAGLQTRGSVFRPAGLAK